MASSVVGDVETVSSKIMWKISNFCMVYFKNVGDFVESPKFKVFGTTYEWYLKLYPRGINDDCKDYLSLYLHTQYFQATSVNLKILNNKDEVVENFAIEDEKLCYSRGTNKLISKDFIVNPVNDMLNNGTLTIVCEITKPTYKVKEINLKEVEQKAAILSRLEVLDTYENLINDSNFSDVSLISEGKTVKVNKHILAKNSSVFAAMFDAEMKEKQNNTVEIDDIKYEVLVEMIRYIYARKVNDIDSLVGELATSADKYALEGLKEMCGKTMAKNLTVDNVIHCLQFAEKLRMDKLKEQAVEFSVKNASDITDKPEFEFLPAGILRKVCYGLSKKTMQ